MHPNTKPALNLSPKHQIATTYNAYNTIDQDRMRPTYSYARLSQHKAPEIQQSPTTETDQKIEIRALKTQIAVLEQKVNQNHEFVMKIQYDYQTQLKQWKENEQMLIDRIKNMVLMQVSQVEKRFLDELKKQRGDGNIGNKVNEMRVEMESKYISLDEKMKIVLNSFENKLNRHLDAAPSQAGLREQFREIGIGIHYVRQLNKQTTKRQVGLYSVL